MGIAFGWNYNYRSCKEPVKYLKQAKNGGRFGGLSHEFCVGKIIEIRTNNGDGYGMRLGFSVE